MFNTYGKVLDVRFHEKEGHGGLRSAFVFYDTKHAAESAIKVLNEVYKFREDSKEPITVSYPRPKGGPGFDRPRDDRGLDRRGPERGHGRAPDRGSGRGPERGHERGHERGDDRGPGRHDRGGHDPRDLDRGGYDRGHDRGADRGGPDRAYDRPGHDRGYGRGGYDRGPPERDAYDRHDRYDRCDERARDRSRDRRFSSDHGKGGGKGGGKKGGNPGSKLYVANLPTDITKDAIDYVFSNYGRVQDIHIMTGRSKSGMAAAFIIYAHVDQARKCLQAMQQGYEIRPGEGNIIVKYADDQREPAGGGRSRDY